MVVNGRCVLVGDGIKIGKEGKKMPGVKWLHQESESNSKAAHIMGHSLQAVSILVQGLKTCFAVPICAEIHEGVRFNHQDKRTLLDKLFEMLIGLSLPQACNLVADKYYCSGRFMKQLVKANIHLVTMMKRNAVAYYPAQVSTQKTRGRPKKYGKKVKLFDLFKTEELQFIQVALLTQPNIIMEYAVKQLLWRPLGAMAQFVFVRHPTRGLSIMMSTDLILSPLDMILCYSLRFKIEVAFKQAIHQVGVFMYHFWLKAMLSRKRDSGDYQLHFKSRQFKDKVRGKLHVYHLFIQLGLIAQGLLQYLSIQHNESVWQHFKTWLRTIRPDTLPSEKVVGLAMNSTYIDFLIEGEKDSNFEKFLQQRLDISQLHYVNTEKIAAT